MKQLLLLTLVSLLFVLPIYISFAQIPSPEEFEIPELRICDSGDTMGQCFARISALILKFIMVAGLVWAAFNLASAGIKFASKGDNPEEVKKIKDKLIYAIIGAVVVLLSWGIISVIQMGIGRGGSF